MTRTAIEWLLTGALVGWVTRAFVERRWTEGRERPGTSYHGWVKPTPWARCTTTTTRKGYMAIGDNLSKVVKEVGPERMSAARHRAAERDRIAEKVVALWGMERHEARHLVGYVITQYESNTTPEEDR